MDDRLTIHWLETGDTRGLYHKYCFMEAAVRGELFFRVRPRSAWAEFGFTVSDLPFFKEGFSFFRASRGNRSILAVLDNKDSFFNISPLIGKVDLYFLGAYAPAIIEAKCFPEPYLWQTEADLAPYREHCRRVVDQFGEMFGKIVRSIPMPMIMHPSLRYPAAESFTPSRFVILGGLLLADRLARKKRWPLLPTWEREMFSIRYRDLLSLRRQRIEYDIVAADTLWAWPEHRARLYHEIFHLPGRRRILTRLSTPRGGNSWPDRMSPAMLAFVRSRLTGAQADFSGGFERLFAASRLNVLACGKHWGWRQLGYISLLCGTPTLMDRPLFTPYFSFDDFELTYTKDQWQELPELLEDLDKDAWDRIRRKNQNVFDRFLAPEPVSRYMLAMIKKCFAGMRNVR